MQWCTKKTRQARSMTFQRIIHATISDHIWQRSDFNFCFQMRGREDYLVSFSPSPFPWKSFGGLPTRNFCELVIWPKGPSTAFSLLRLCTQRGERDGFCICLTVDHEITDCPSVHTRHLPLAEKSEKEKRAADQITLTFLPNISHTQCWFLADHYLWRS